jgi:hypothetical protein
LKKKSRNPAQSMDNITGLRLLEGVNSGNHDFEEFPIFGGVRRRAHTPKNRPLHHYSLITDND